MICPLSSTNAPNTLDEAPKFNFTQPEQKPLFAAPVAGQTFEFGGQQVKNEVAQKVDQE